MSVSPSPTPNDAGGRGAAPVPPARCWMRRMALGAVACCAAAALAVAAGFWWFVWSVPTHEVELDGNADGIVVLTGGSSRVADALELLSAGRGKRLLITGVHQATTAAAIARGARAYGPLIACCVDRDHSALKRHGNGR